MEPVFFYAIAYFLNNKDYIKNENKLDVICGYALRVRGFLYQKYKFELENTPNDDIASNEYWEDIGISRAESMKDEYPLFSRTNSGTTDINNITPLRDWVDQLKPPVPPECNTTIYADQFDFNAMGIFLFEKFNIDLIIKQNYKYYHINSHNLYKFDSEPTAMTDHELKKQYNNKQSIFITHAGEHFDVLQKQNGLLPDVNTIPSTYFALNLPPELKRLISDFIPTSTQTKDSRLVHEFISLLIESAIKGLYNKTDIKRLFKTTQNGVINGLNEASKSTIENWEIMPNEKESKKSSFFNAIDNILTNIDKSGAGPFEKNDPLTEEEYRIKIYNYLNEQNEESMKYPTNKNPSILFETKHNNPELFKLDDATILKNILDTKMDIDHELALVCIEEIYKMKFILLQTPPIKDKEFTINTRVKFTLSNEKETTYGTIQSIGSNNRCAILLDDYKLIEVDKSRLEMSNRYVIATGSGVRMKQKKNIKCCAFILCSSDEKPIYNALRYKLTTRSRETTTTFKYVWEINNLPSYLNYMIFMVAYGFSRNGTTFGSLNNVYTEITRLKTQLNKICKLVRYHLIEKDIIEYSKDTRMSKKTQPVQFGGAIKQDIKPYLYTSQDALNSKNTYYIVIDLDLYPGTSIPFGRKITMGCDNKYEHIREAYSDLRGLNYEAGEVNFPEVTTPGPRPSVPPIAGPVASAPAIPIPVARRIQAPLSGPVARRIQAPLSGPVARRIRGGGKKTKKHRKRGKHSKTHAKRRYSSKGKSRRHKRIKHKRKTRRHKK